MRHSDWYIREHFRNPSKHHNHLLQRQRCDNPVQLRVNSGDNAFATHHCVSRTSQCEWVDIGDR